MFLFTHLRASSEKWVPFIQNRPDDALVCSFYSHTSSLWPLVTDILKQKSQNKCSVNVGPSALCLSLWLFLVSYNCRFSQMSIFSVQQLGGDRKRKSSIIYTYTHIYIEILFYYDSRVYFKSGIWLMGMILPQKWSQMNERESKEFHLKDWYCKNWGI